MLSFVIPAINEAPSLETLRQEIVEAATAAGHDYEIIFIDDGSKDATWSTIASLAADDSHVRGIRFRRNFGKAAALTAGFEASRGETVFTLDADLQDDPREIPKFLEKLSAGADVISGWKKKRHDPWHKVFPSRVFNWLVGKLTGVKLHDHNCGFKCYRRDVIEEVRIHGELHRFVPVLAAAQGFSVAEVEVNHRPRKFGSSNYGLTRIVKGFLDLLTVLFLTSYRKRPQHLLGTFGLSSFFLGAAGITYLAIYWVVKHYGGYTTWPPLHDRPLLHYSIALLLLGGQFIAIGILAELITATMGRDAPQYSIRERVGG
jgi:glycosyltransferase involved in cell wall biosynthesis